MVKRGKLPVLYHRDAKYERSPRQRRRRRVEPKQRWNSGFRVFSHWWAWIQPLLTHQSPVCFISARHWITGKSHSRSITGFLLWLQNKSVVCKRVARPLPSSLLDLQTNVVHVATCCTELCTTYTSGPVAQKVITNVKTDQWQSSEGKKNNERLTHATEAVLYLSNYCIFKSNYAMPQPKRREEEL